MDRIGRRELVDHRAGGRDAVEHRNAHVVGRDEQIGERGAAVHAATAPGAADAERVEPARAVA